MKSVFFAIVVFLVATSAGAQSYSLNPSLLKMPAMPGLDGTSVPIQPLTLVSADNTGNHSFVVNTSPIENTAASATLGDSSAANSASPQYVQSVFQEFPWQIYAGYTFVRFYQVPGVQVNTNGLNFGVVYYIRDWVGAEGEFTGTFGSQYGDTAKFLLGMGGLRFRWSAPRGIEVWAHGLIGGSHYLPQTANGAPHALAYELGGGVDISAGRRRWAYRVAVDAVATQYFSTYQFSPKASAGIVFKF